MERFVGLMSGTSIDGIDAALVEWEDERLRLVCTHRKAIPKSIANAVARLNLNSPVTPAELGMLDVRLGRLFGLTVRGLLRKAHVPATAITAIGSPGQTVFHSPVARVPNTMQLGDPNTIAEMTGIATVADFRRRDMAAGGQGAPLVPAFHRVVFSCDSEHRVVLNIGGIANITILPPSPEETLVVGFDTGPGNSLMDLWASARFGKPMDTNGNLAEKGRLSRPLLNALLNKCYFRSPPPKSTGREEMGWSWLKQCIARCNGQASALDVARTLCELTVRTVTSSIREHAPLTHRVLACGGGTNNGFLMTRLRKSLSPMILETTELHGISPEWVEAMAFAWLARQTVKGCPGNLTAVTGARHPVTLGGIYSAR